MSTEFSPKWLQRFYLALFGFLPWSVEWPVGKTWSLTVPAEPLIALCGLGVLVVLLNEKAGLTLRRRLAYPGLAWVAMLWVVWQAVVAVYSTMPLVSWKYWLVEAGQCGVFFGAMLFWPQWWPRLIRVFSYSLAGVTVYTLVHHALNNFQTDQAVLASMPFFPDHTMYSAVLVMVLLGWGLPQLFQVMFPWKRSLASPGAVVCSFLVPALLLLALYFIFSRAAWLSFLLAGFTGLAIRFQKYWPCFLLVLLLSAGGGYMLRDNISARLSADVSSMERLNRYSCALRMAKERPWTGFGPGTFPFRYLPFQRSGEMTRISITEPIGRRGPQNYGRGGGAHSEYFQALTETGWPGLICWLLLTAGSITVGIRRYRREAWLLWLALTISLLSFFLHGLVNNFLHDARVAALVWGQMAVLISASLNAGRHEEANAT